MLAGFCRTGGHWLEMFLENLFDIRPEGYHLMLISYCFPSRSHAFLQVNKSDVGPVPWSLSGSLIARCIREITRGGTRNGCRGVASTPSIQDEKYFHFHGFLSVLCCMVATVFIYNWITFILASMSTCRHKRILLRIPRGSMRMWLYSMGYFCEQKGRCSILGDHFDTHKGKYLGAPKSSCSRLPRWSSCGRCLSHCTHEVDPQLIAQKVYPSGACKRRHEK